MLFHGKTCRIAVINSFISSDKYRITVRPELVEGLRHFDKLRTGQAQPERFGVMIYENVNKLNAS